MLEKKLEKFKMLTDKDLKDVVTRKLDDTTLYHLESVCAALDIKIHKAYNPDLVLPGERYIQISNITDYLSKVINQYPHNIDNEIYINELSLYEIALNFGNEEIKEGVKRYLISIALELERDPYWVA